MDQRGRSPRPTRPNVPFWTRPNVPFWILALSMLVAGAGCGGSDDKRVATPTPTSTSTPTPTATPTPRAGFEGVGVLSDQPGATSRVFGVSGDGAFVVGTSDSPDGFEAFRWSAASGLEGLGVPPQKVNSDGLSANQDGSVVAGAVAGFMGTAPRAARWSESGGWELLLDSGEDFVAIQARGISADGNTVVGAVQYQGSLVREAFLWTPTAGIRLLGRPDDTSTLATGVSADGTVVSAVAIDSAGDRTALRWTSSSGFVELPILDGTDSCLAQNVSADGNTIVGFCGPDNDPQAVLWDSRGVVGLGTLPGGIGSLLQAVSGDGSVGAGVAGDTEGTTRAAIWTQASGMQDLRDVLVELGLEAEIEGWFLSAANAISSDGRVIAGTGFDPQGRERGFVAMLP